MDWPKPQQWKAGNLEMTIYEMIKHKCKYEIIYQLDAIEYLFVFFQLDICCICKETVTSIAPEDGCISPKHVKLKEHK